MKDQIKVIKINGLLADYDINKLLGNCEGYDLFLVDSFNGHSRFKRVGNSFEQIQRF